MNAVVVLSWCVAVVLLLAIAALFGVVIARLARRPLRPCCGCGKVETSGGDPCQRCDSW